MGLKEELERLAENQQQDDETVLKALGKLFNNENIELKTEINDTARVSLLLSLQQQFKENSLREYEGFLDTFISNFLDLQVSKDRQGRKEAVEILKENREQEKSEEKKQLEKLLEKR